VRFWDNVNGSAVHPREKIWPERSRETVETYLLIDLALYESNVLFVQQWPMGEIPCERVPVLRCVCAGPETFLETAQDRKYKRSIGVLAK
jgi:hypothetical protein